MKTNEYTPDILNCLANLSNDEVFTPPEVANAMLDLLPQDLFRSPTTRFLDPCCKSGVFLREITKRLIDGLAEQIPDLQERVTHILTQQVYGVALTTLTAEMSRRTLYCAKRANSAYSVAPLATEDGNIYFRRLQHRWENGRCTCCGANQKEYQRSENLETYAYPFIHQSIKTIYPMQFDVIIGNPPYQLSKATDKTTNNGAFASAIYPYFIDNALNLSPKYLIMIIPSRWMTRAGQGVSDKWIDKMLKGNHFVEIHDYLDACECFPGVEIKGGVNYFLYRPDYVGKCRYYLHSGDSTYERYDVLDSLNAGLVLRDKMAIDIIDKIAKVEGQYYKGKSFYNLVSPKHFFDKDELLSSNWRGYSTNKDAVHSVKYYLNKRLESNGYAWIKESDIPKGKTAIGLHKVYIPKAGGSGTDDIILGKPFYGEPNSVCSYTYLCIGYNPTEHNFTKEQCENIITYMKTRFFRYLVSVKKKTQDASRDVYQFVPLQDFSRAWTDEELYRKYALSPTEVAFIESMIRPMD